MHPWAQRPFVMETLAEFPDQAGKNPSRHLVAALAGLFVQMMPSTPPKHGKRLDTRWGEFGILAAQYFAPLLYGAPFPASLRDAWGRIDESILYFISANQGIPVSQEEKETYKLVGNELEIAPNSTISDWHRKGLQRLNDLITARENYLSASLSAKNKNLSDEQLKVGEESPPKSAERVPKTRKIRPGGRRVRVLLVVLFVVSLLLAGGLKAWKIYGLAQQVRMDALGLREIIAGPAPRLEKMEEIGPALKTLRKDFSRLKAQVEPFFWIGPWMSWVPVHGNDLVSIEDLAVLADSMLAAGDYTYQAALPALTDNDLASLDPARLTELLNQARPRLLDSRNALDQAVAARGRLTTGDLSPEIRDLIINDLDPVIALMGDGLTVALAFPRLMGASEEGPKTYLLLVQNEDELRPTGGFITAAGTLLVKDGRISSLNFKSSEYFDNWDKPYPVAPWQLSQYMNSRVLIFRDANWFTNYPTAALYAEYLYSYTSDHSVDGVIAFDQQMLVKVLSATGPIKVEGVPYPIDAANVVDYMREAKTPTPEDLASPDWNNKVFINKISRALISKIFSGDVEWDQLSKVLLDSLNEHHLLIQLDDPEMTSLLKRFHWDGSVRPGNGDFLMVVDSNIGFNKTNAVVESSISYDVDLAKLQSPTASLTIFHKNNAEEIVFCKHWNKVRAEGEQGYPITDCYWNYLRVYMKERTRLLDATPQVVPDNWMILKQKNPGQVDILKEEIDGVQAFGTLQVLLGGQSLSTTFHFALPADILSMQPDSDHVDYHLKIQKQPGTLGVPITIRIHLPKGTLIQSSPSEAIVQGNSILYKTDLTTDIEIDVVFSPP